MTPGKHAMDGEMSDIQPVLDVIERDIDFEHAFYNDAYLERRITSRMRRTDVDTHEEYAALLAREPAEHDALLDSLSINVTQFFRNPSVWEPLRDAIRELSRTQRRVRIWSSPCADGREPYSLAMLALDDDETNENRVEITATDINHDVLEVAKRGRYRTTRTTNIEQELEPLESPRRCIEQHENTFTVKDVVKRNVTFAQHDLIRDDPLTDFDVVLCRNLLIYIDAAFKRPMFETLLGSLRDGGYLLIGKSETVPREFRDDLAVVDQRNRLYKKQ